MRLTARQLNRATLDRQLLLRRGSVGVAEAVRRIVALQAQEPASPYLALWNRLATFDPADLDAAFAGRRGRQGDADAHHPPRGPCRGLPAVPRRDGPQPARLASRRSPLHRSAACRSPRPTRSCPASSRSPSGRAPARRWRRTWARRLDGAATARVVGDADVRAPAPRPDGRAVVVRAEGGVRRGAGDAAARDARDESIRWLARRYLEGFGPAIAAGPRAVHPAHARRRPGGDARPRRRARRAGRTRRTTLFDVAGADDPGRGLPRPTAAAPDVGQHAARLRGPRPRDPAGLPAASSSARTATSCRRSSSTASSPACGDRSRAASRPRPSMRCRTTRGPGSRRGAGAGGVPRRSRPAGLSPLRPLVAQAAAGRGGPASSAAERRDPGHAAVRT